MADEQDFDWLKALASALAAGGGALAGRAIANNGPDPLTRAVPPELSQLLQMSMQRQAFQNPLFEATTKGTFDMLPTFAKTGSQLSGSLPNAIPAPTTSASSGSGGPGLGTAASMGALAALARALGGGGGNSGGALGPILKKIKELLSRHGGPTVQGNKPGPGGIGPTTNPYDPFQGWAGNDGMDYDQWPGSDPFGGNVNTDEFMGQWPENSDPFAPFDPGMLPGGTGGYDEPWGP